MELYPNKSGLGLMEPIALINYNVCLLTGSTKQFRKVTWFEGLAPFQFLNIGALAAATTSGKTQGVNLELGDGEFGQYRWYPIDNVQVRLFIPQANGRGILDRLQVPIDMQVVTRDPDLHFTEMFIWEDNVPWFEAINGMAAEPLAQVRLIAQGFRYITEPITDTVLLNNIKAGRADCVYLPSYGQSSQVI